MNINMQNVDSCSKRLTISARFQCDEIVSSSNVKVYSIYSIAASEYFSTQVFQEKGPNRGSQKLNIRERSDTSLGTNA